MDSLFQWEILPWEGGEELAQSLRGVVHALSLEVFKVKLDGALSDLL